MGFGMLAAGLALFLGTHVFTSRRAARTALRDRLGEAAYKGLYSVVALIGFVLIIYGYGAMRASAQNFVIWTPPSFFSHITLLLMWPAFIVFVAAYLPGYIKKVTKHPMLLGTKIWAFSHLLANGDFASILLFGSFLAWAVYARISLKARERVEPRTAFTPKWTVDIVAVVVGTAIYLAFAFLFHALWIGVPVIPGR
jgi:uncharacterized membrane protein